MPRCSVCGKVAPETEMYLVRGRWFCERHYKEAKPTLKKLMKGEVLDGYIEAARAKTLEEFG